MLTGVRCMRGRVRDEPCASGSHGWRREGDGDRGDVDRGMQARARFRLGIGWAAGKGLGGPWEREAAWEAQG